MWRGPSSSSSRTATNPKSSADAYDPRNQSQEVEKKPASFYVGMAVATLFGGIYYIRPIHLIPFLYMIYYGYPSFWFARICFGTPLLTSLVLPTVSSSFAVVKLLQPLLDYFEYDEIQENTPVNVREAMALEGKRYLFVTCPHGMVPFTSICWHVRKADKQLNRTMKQQSQQTSVLTTVNENSIPPMAVARMVLYTPILKHVMGLFDCIVASTSSLQAALEHQSVSLWVGATEEIFESTPHTEVLYLSKRRGFIKLALQCPDIDIVPVYLFGNSSCYSTLQWTFLKQISQGLQLPFTYPIGMWNLPIPRNEKLLHVTGQPLGLPYLPRPRPHQVKHWHRVYCKQVQRLFETYKGRHPKYKNKTLVII